jgi:hypothetical protein
MSRWSFSSSSISTQTVSMKMFGSRRDLGYGLRRGPITGYCREVTQTNDILLCSGELRGN